MYHLRNIYRELKRLDAQKTNEDFCDDERLEALVKFVEQLPCSIEEAVAANCNVVIQESEWEEYCQSYAEDCGFIQRNCPLIDLVDWEGWAELMAADHLKLDLDGETVYWKR